MNVFVQTYEYRTCNAAFKVQVEEGDAVGGQEGGERKRRLKPSVATREAYLGTRYSTGTGTVAPLLSRSLLDPI